MEPASKKSSRARAAMLERLRKAGVSVAEGESALFRAKRRRDGEIKKASELGLSRREVGRAVGLTAAGIQRILRRG